MIGEEDEHFNAHLAIAQRSLQESARERGVPAAGKNDEHRVFRLEPHAADRNAKALHSAHTSPRRVKTGTRTGEMAPNAEKAPKP